MKKIFVTLFTLTVLASTATSSSHDYYNDDARNRVKIWFLKLRISFLESRLQTLNEELSTLENPQPEEAPQPEDTPKEETPEDTPEKPEEQDPQPQEEPEEPQPEEPNEPQGLQGNPEFKKYIEDRNESANFQDFFEGL